MKDQSLYSQGQTNLSDGRILVGDSMGANILINIDFIKKKLRGQLPYNVVLVSAVK